LEAPDTKKIDGVETAIEIGWSFLSRAYWGGRYNKSMKNLMIKYAFDYVNDIIFYIGENNIRSRRAVEKIGAKQVIGGEVDHLIRHENPNLPYRLNRTDWQNGFGVGAE